jgi:CheY-like chemotaxis protein
LKIAKEGATRLRICKRPRGTIDGIAIDRFQIGEVYEVGTQLASVLLAEGWAEYVTTSGATVLVVDDDLIARQYLAELLTHHGYEVVLACHGREALARLCEHEPDLVLLDLNMPVMNGWEFRAEQQRLPEAHLAQIPVLVLTAVERTATRASALNAAGLVEKPFDPERLLNAVREVLRAA